MSDRCVRVCCFAILAAAVLLAGCSSEPAQTQPAQAPEKKADDRFNYRLSTVWYPSADKPEELRIEFWIQNKTEEDVNFEFADAGRVCGFIRKPGGAEVLRYPQAAAQVTGTETLKGGWDKSYTYSIPASELAGLAPGRYEVKGWLCGHEDMHSWADFFVHQK